MNLKKNKAFIYILVFLQFFLIYISILKNVKYIKYDNITFSDNTDMNLTKSQLIMHNTTGILIILYLFTSLFTKLPYVKYVTIIVILINIYIISSKGITNEYNFYHLKHIPYCLSLIMNLIPLFPILYLVYKMNNNGGDIYTVILLLILNSPSIFVLGTDINNFKSLSNPSMGTNGISKPNSRAKCPFSIFFN